MVEHFNFHVAGRTSVHTYISQMRPYLISLLLLLINLTKTIELITATRYLVDLSDLRVRHVFFVLYKGF